MKIAVTEFKSKCLKVMNEISITRQPVIITKRGKPIAQLTPIEPEPEATLFGYMTDTAAITGDIIAPIGEPWSAITGGEDELYAVQTGTNDAP